MIHGTVAYCILGDQSTRKNGPLNKAPHKIICISNNIEEFGTRVKETFPHILARYLTALFSPFLKRLECEFELLCCSPL